LISPKGSAEDQKAIADLIRANDRLGLNIGWAGDVKKEIQSVYAAARATNFFPGEPSAGSIYDGKP
jgi:hypothetical protein